MSLIGHLQNTKFRIVLLSALGCFLVACSEQSLPPTVTPIPVGTEETTTTATRTESLLIWEGVGTSQNQPARASAHRLSWLQPDGQTAPLYELSASTTQVALCGNFTVNNASLIYAGSDRGQLLSVPHDGSAPTQVDTVSYLTCLDNTALQPLATADQIAYIKYPDEATRNEFAMGTLNVIALSDPSTPLLTADRAVAFDVHGDQITYVSFYANAQNQIDEAAIIRWDGTATREMSTLTPLANNCRFVSASVIQVDAEQTVVILGQRCAGTTATNRLIYAVQNNGTATLIANENQVGAYVAFARTNRVFATDTNPLVFYTAPDGINAYTVHLRQLNLADASTQPLIENSLVFENYSGGSNITPLFSGDGNWLFAVETTPNHENTLIAYDLLTPAVPPIRVSAGARGDVVSNLTLSVENNTIFFIIGGENGDDNSLLSLNLDTESQQRIQRGNFGRGFVVNRSGQIVAVPQWITPAEPRQPRYTDLVQIDLATGAQSVLFTGADVIDGEVSNLRFAVPLLWASQSD